MEALIWTDTVIDDLIDKKSLIEVQSTFDAIMTKQ